MGYSNRWIISGILVISLLLSSCKENAGHSGASLQAVKLEGRTMGTTYHITYLDSTSREFNPAIDSILVAINLEVSTYIDTATISLFNKAEKQMTFGTKQRPEHFISNLEKAKEIWEKSNAAFDPTVMPLVQYWGFGTEKRAVTKVDSLKVDSLKALTGFQQISWTLSPAFSIQKARTEVQLDFSALAKGYGVDVLGEWLSAKGINNYMVEIGGEVLARGKNAKSNWWTIGINTPSESANAVDYEAVVELHDKALATSGNYRNYYELNGKKYGHTINPATGFPEQTRLLSASVFADDCATADALATAFMVMGLEKAFALATSLPAVEAYFIYGNEEGGMSARYTAGVADLLKN